MTGLVLLATERACELWTLEKPSEQIPAAVQIGKSLKAGIHRQTSSSTNKTWWSCSDIADLKNRPQITKWY